MKKAIFATLMAFTASAVLAATPTITITEVEKHSSPDGKADITYTVANVTDAADYYVRFTATTNGAANAVELWDFDKTETLACASNGTYTVTAHHFDTNLIWNANIAAELVYAPGKNGDDSPYATMFVIVDLGGGPNAENYPYTTESRYWDSLNWSTNRYNTDFYKTNSLVLRRIRACTFTMGSPNGETGRLNGIRTEGNWFLGWETQHQVTLTKDYLIGLFPVTQAQYEKVMGTNPSVKILNAPLYPVDSIRYGNDQQGKPDLRGETRGGDVLANGIVADDSFMGRLRRKTKGAIKFDLPTEAQWECACRAGTTGSVYFPIPNGGTCLRETDEDKALLIQWTWSIDGTWSPVGRKPANPWGLYDMLGTCFEVCRDHVSALYGIITGENADKVDNPGASPVNDPLRDTGTHVICRSGSSTYGVTLNRCAMRNCSYDMALFNHNNYGGYHKPVSAEASFRLMGTVPVPNGGADFIVPEKTVIWAVDPVVVKGTNMWAVTFSATLKPEVTISFDEWLEATIAADKIKLAVDDDPGQLKVVSPKNVLNIRKKEGTEDRIVIDCLFDPKDPEAGGIDRRRTHFQVVILE